MLQLSTRNMIVYRGDHRHCTPKGVQAAVRFACYKHCTPHGVLCSSSLIVELENVFLFKIYFELP